MFKMNVHRTPGTQTCFIFLEYPPGYKRAINLALNGTFSNGKDQQQGEILMNIDALRKYDRNQEQVRVRTKTSNVEPKTKTSVL